MELFTNVSNLGYGAYWAGRWFNHHWSSDQSRYTIAWKELYAILVACSTWGNLWRRKRILFHCDNTAVVAIWGKGTCKCPHLMSLVRHLFLMAAGDNYHVAIAHIPGALNQVAQPGRRSPLPFLHAGVPTGSPGSKPSPSYHSHPCTRDRPLTTRMQALQVLRVAPSTRRTYQSGITSFQEFCSTFSLPPLPTSPLTLRYFCAHMPTDRPAVRPNYPQIQVLFTHIPFPSPFPPDSPLLLRGIMCAVCPLHALPTVAMRGRWWNGVCVCSEYCSYWTSGPWLVSASPAIPLLRRRWRLQF